MTSTRELYGQALALQKQGQFAQAETLYRRIVAAEPSAFPPRHMLGVVLAQLGRLDEAQAQIGAALKLNPRDAGAWANQGNVLNLLGRGEEAVAAYDRALALQPDAGTWNNRGNALQGLNRRAEALASFEQALT